MRRKRGEGSNKMRGKRRKGELRDFFLGLFASMNEYGYEGKFVGQVKLWVESRPRA
jgi:hypothetical protein